METMTKMLERRFTDDFNTLVNTGALLNAFKQMIPILSYHARETVYRTGSAVNRVYDHQFVTLPNGTLMRVHVTVEQLLDDDDRLADDLEANGVPR